MNGLSSDLDLTFLCGRMILQLCVGLHDLILNFNDDVVISIESKLGIGIDHGKEHTVLVPKDIHQLTELLQVSVTNFRIDENGGLFLFFKNNTFLHIHNDSKQYESFVIMDKGRKIVA